MNIPQRQRPPETRTAITHRFCIADQEGYITVGLYEDGRPCELFITMSKADSTVGGLLDTLGIVVSVAFQYGVPLEALVKTTAHQRFEPSGFTAYRDLRSVPSITAYVFRWMTLQFGVQAPQAPVTNNRISSPTEGGDGS